MSKKISELGKQGKLIYTIPSDTTGEIYEIRFIDEEKYTCTCLGFMTSKTRPKSCKHLRRYFLIQILKSIANDLVNHFDEGDLSWIEVCRNIEKLFKKEINNAD